MKKKTMRQLLSSVMAAVLLLGNLSISAGAASADPAPVPLTEPKIELQGNVVKDQFGKLTGFFELSIRVQTMTNQTMKSIMMALEYDPTVLEPVTWDAAANEAGLVPTISLGTGDYTTQLPAKKMDNTTGAVALTGAAQGAGAKGTEGKSLLYFRAESQKSVELSQMTTLAVIRFHIEKTEMAKFTLSDDGKLQYDGADGVLTKFVNFAPDAAAADSPALRTLHCSCNDKEYALAAADKFAVLSPDSVSLTLVSEESFVKTGIDLNKVCVITYTDWDGTPLGTQVVPQNADARKMVNDYVEQNFVHPDLRGTMNDTTVKSLTRADTYRGKYPYSGPMGSSTETVDNGEKFAITNKLDYVFFKRVLKLDDANQSNPIWKQSDDNPYDKAYPYIHGWALVDSSEGDTWTTLGVGELANYNATTGELPVTGENKYFKPASFSDIKVSAMTVKAVYEPGEKLTSGFYIPSKQPTYERYGTMDTTLGGAYAIMYQYERVDANGYGVKRARELTLLLQYSIDTAGTKGGDFYMEYLTENKDVVDITVTPSSAITSFDYYLQDKYGSNYVAGAQRSSSLNELKLPSNFDYVKFEFKDRLGSDGFVTRGTLVGILKAGTNVAAAEAKGDTQKAQEYRDVFVGVFGLETAKDINWRVDLTGKEYTSLTLSGGQNQILAAIKESYTNKPVDCVDLSWHQIQWYILDNVLYEKAQADAKVITWCRLHDACIEAGGAAPIESLADLLLGAIEVAKNPASTALNKLTETFYLRTGISGVEYANISLFKNAFVSMVTRLRSAGVTDAVISAMTWRQAQYLLEYSSINTIPSTVAEDYWWEAGGKKVITDLPTLLTVANNIKNHGYDSSWFSGLTLQNVKDIKLRQTESGKAFTNLDTFRAALYGDAGTSAMDRLMSAPGIYTDANVADAEVMEVQHVLFAENTFRSDDELRGDPGIVYYWITGAPTINSLTDMLVNAWKVYIDGAEDGLLGNLTLVYVNSEYLRADKAGNAFGYLSTFKDALKTAIKSFEIAGINLVDIKNDAISWDELQYALIYGTYQSDPVTGEDFWWKLGGSKTITTLAELKIAAWQAYGGSVENPMALNGLPILDVINGADGVPNDDHFFLRKDAKGILFNTLDEVKNALRTAVKTAKNSLSQTAFEKLSWIELQHLMLGENYRSESALRGDPKIIYWWERGGNKPSEPTTDYSQANAATAVLTAIASNVVNNTGNLAVAADIVPYLADDLIVALNLHKTPSDVFTPADKNLLAQFIVDAEGLVWGDSCEGEYADYNDYTIHLPWKALQYFILNGSHQSESKIPDFAWVPSNTVPVPATNSISYMMTPETTTRAWTEEELEIQALSMEQNRLLVQLSRQPDKLPELMERIQEITTRLAELSSLMAAASEAPVEQVVIPPENSEEESVHPPTDPDQPAEPDEEKEGKPDVTKPAKEPDLAEPGKPGEDLIQPELPSQPPRPPALTEEELSRAASQSRRVSGLDLPTPNVGSTLAPFFKSGGVAIDRGGGRALPYSRGVISLADWLQVLLFQKRDPLWAELPTLTWCSTPRGRVALAYAPIPVVRAET